jgi:Leucine-rich repeat (LRR) protein
MKCIKVDFKSRAFDIPDELFCLPRLEEFHVVGPGARLPPSWGNLTSLNLTYTSLCVHDLIQSLIKTPSITELVVYNAFDDKQGRAIPTEFGNLTSLKELRMVSNHFYGSVPKEISRLTNLTRLHVQEHYCNRNFELIIHPSIVALTIPDLVFGFVDDLGIRV